MRVGLRKTLGVNRSVEIDTMGSKMRSYLKELRVEGLRSFVAQSLFLSASGAHITSEATFEDLQLAARLQAQVQSTDPERLLQDCQTVQNHG